MLFLELALKLQEQIPLAIRNGADVLVEVRVVFLVFVL